MLKRAVRDQIVSMLGTLQEGVEYAQQAKVFMAKKIFFDSVASIESIMAVAEEGISPEKNAEYQEIFGRLLPLFRTSKINEGDFIRQNLAQLTSMFEAEREICREVLFLPYKASMWDSLESIWRAANDDADCECYVMPIPYCDRNPDGSAAKWHYEGDLFPVDVPITSFEAYDIAQRKPDIIYFHNPYDDYNRVTSVHPAYYSRELKKHTQKLVYVPYFVTDGKGISDHFCQVPGVENADIVVAQSEEVKAVYAKFIPAEKVLALGSPKFDKVIWNQQHKPPMPPEWEEIAQGRKLILYNTHLTPLMIDDGSVCRKLRYVFSCFEGRDDVCLLWRPHPLSEATMQAMNPKALAEYHQMVAEYKKSGLGIYDESPDVHRAIALSAAYYGDTSSLVPMYEVTGKPIMIQDIGLVSEIDHDKRNLYFTNVIIDDKFAWFSDIFFNQLFKYDLEREEIVYHQQMPECETAQDYDYAFGNVFKWRGKLYFIPLYTNAIAVFDINTLSFTTYMLPPKKCRTYLGVSLDKYIYLFPSGGEGFYRFDTDGGELENFSDWEEKIKSYGINLQENFFTSIIQDGEYIWSTCYNENIMIKFDLTAGEIEFYRIGQERSGFLGMTYDGDFFWLVSAKNLSIVFWHPKSQKAEILNKFPKEIEKIPYCFGRCAYSNGFVWIMPYYGEHILKISVKTKKMEICRYPDEFIFHKSSSYMLQKHGGLFVENGTINVSPINVNMMLQIDSNTNKIKGKKIQLAGLIKVEVLKEKLEYNKLCFDNVLGRQIIYEYNMNQALPVCLDLVSIDIGLEQAIELNKYGFLHELCGEKIHQCVLLH